MGGAKRSKDPPIHQLEKNLNAQRLKELLARLARLDSTTRPLHVQPLVDPRVPSQEPSAGFDVSLGQVTTEELEETLAKWGVPGLQRSLMLGSPHIQQRSPK